MIVFNVGYCLFLFAEATNIENYNNSFRYSGFYETTEKVCTIARAVSFSFSTTCQMLVLLCNLQAFLFRECVFITTRLGLDKGLE